MAFVETVAIEVSRASVPGAADRPDPVPGPDVRRGDRALRLRQARRALRHGARRPRAGARRCRRARRRRGSASSIPPSAAGGRVKAIVAPGMAGITRREIDELTDRARRFGAKGLAYLALEPGGEVKGPIAKFLSDDTRRAIIERAGAAEGDLILIVADTHDVTADVLGRLRVELADRLALADPNVLSYVWIHRFPMYQWDAENQRWDATHNPFSGVDPRGRAPPDDGLRAILPCVRPRTRPAEPVRRSTTSRSTAGSWAAARSGSTTATSSSAPSCSRVTRSKPSRRSSARFSTPSSTGRRHTAASPSASTAGRRCSRARRTSAR